MSGNLEDKFFDEEEWKEADTLIKDSIINKDEIHFLEELHNSVFSEPLSEDYLNYYLDTFSIYKILEKSDNDSKYLAMVSTMAKMGRDSGL